MAGGKTVSWWQVGWVGNRIYLRPGGTRFDGTGWYAVERVPEHCALYLLLPLSLHTNDDLPDVALVGTRSTAYQSASKFTRIVIDGGTVERLF